jgi:hypothetical protein
METINEPKLATRELTKTEIDIAVAQIADRLMRFVRFAEDINRHNDKILDQDDEREDLKLVDYHVKTSWSRFAELHNIPDGVHPMFDEALTTHNVKDVSAHIRKWVRGILSPEDCDILITYASIWNEYDLGWVFMDSPSFYYQGDACIEKENFAKFLEIGSRNYKGNPDYCTINLEFMGTIFKPTR